MGRIGNFFKEAAVIKQDHSWLGTFVLALAMAVAACDRREERPPDVTERAETAAEVPAPAPVVPNVTEDSDGVAEVDGRQSRAYEFYVRQEYEAAADEILATAAHLREKAEGATVEIRDALLASAREADRLEADVRRGAVTSVSDINRAFANARHALARHHLLRAQEAWARKEVAQAGGELRLAAHQVESASRDLGEDIQSGGAAAIRDARDIADKLVRGAGWTEGEVDRGMEGLDRALDRLGEKLGVRR